MVTTLGAWTGGGTVFDKPRGVAVDLVGDVYVADYSQKIWKGSPTTFAAVKVFDPGFNAGLFGFRLTAPLDRLMIVESSTNLVNWLPIWTNTLTGNSFYSQQFSDLRSGAYPKRFYRTHLP